MPDNKAVSHEEWLRARLELLAAETEVAHPSMNFSRSSALDGVISRISALTTSFTTNGSAFTLP